MNDLILNLKYCIYAFLIWIGVDKETFVILLLLMCIDSFLGVMKSIRLGRKFKFKILIWGFTLKLCFLIIPLVVSLLGKQLGYDFSSSVNLVIIVLSVSEIYSSLGNIYAAKNKVELERVDVISMLLKSLRSNIENSLKKVLFKIEKGSDCNIK